MWFNWFLPQIVIQKNGDVETYLEFVFSYYEPGRKNPEKLKCRSSAYVAAQVYRMFWPHIGDRYNRIEYHSDGLRFTDPRITSVALCRQLRSLSNDGYMVDCVCWASWKAQQITRDKSEPIVWLKRETKKAEDMPKMDTIGKCAWSVVRADAIQTGMTHFVSTMTNECEISEEYEAWIPLTVSLAFSDARLRVVRRWLAADGFMYSVWSEDSEIDCGYLPVPDGEHDSEISDIDYIVDEGE